MVPADSPVYVGTLGYRRSDTAAAALDEADLVLAIGTVLGEIDTDGYTLRQRPDARTVIVSPDPARIGHSGPVTRHVLARPDVFAAELAALDVPPRPEWPAWRARLRTAQEHFTAIGTAPEPPGAPVTMTGVLRELVTHLPRDVIVTERCGQPLRMATALPPDPQLPGAARTPQRLDGIQHPVGPRRLPALPATARRDGHRRR